MTDIFAYQINEKDRGFFDFVAHMPLDDALAYGSMVQIMEQRWDGLEETMTENDREELEVLKAVAPQGRKRDTYVHPSLMIPSKQVGDGRRSMTPIVLPPDFKDMIAHGVHAMAFDEDVGRLVVATKMDRKLHVFDFAHKRERG